MKQNSIRKWPSKERPREKLLQGGASNLSDAELLAIFLRTGVQGASAVDLATSMLQNFGSLRSILRSSCAEFCHLKGLGPSKYANLQAGLELGARVLAENMTRGETLSSPQVCKDYLMYRLRDKQHESFFVLYLDSKNRLIFSEELFRGTIDSASVPVREVVKESLYHNAAAMIVAHNHPSGVADPSLSDRALTDSLYSALQLVGVRLLDHFVVGDTEVISFAELGLLDPR